MEEHPLFSKDQSVMNVENNEMLQALQSLKYDQQPIEIA
jgi:hypothetical protein